MRDISDLLRRAASIGAQQKANDEANKGMLSRSQERLVEAKNDTEARSRDNSGFGTGMFLGLALCGAEFASEFNDSSSQEAKDAAAAVASSFVSSFTGATDKTTKGGGTVSGYIRAVSLGANTERVRAVLQGRLLHWYGIIDTADDLEPAQAKAAKAQARRFVTVCGDAPMPDGSWPKGNDGVAKRPKHNGRPAASINGVDIPAGRGTDRKAQFAGALDLFDRFGDRVLNPDVIDAFLDNGGKFESSASMNPTVLAGKALESIEALNLAGGNTSADAGFLALCAAMLGRISREGLMASAAAPVAIVQAEPEAPTPEPEAESQAEPEVQATGEAAEAPVEAPTEGEGVVLGAPAAPATSGRGARPRRTARGG